MTVKLEEVEVLIQHLGNQIEPQLPKGWGFFLHVSSFGKGGFCTHITNVDPVGMVDMLDEWLARVRSDGFCSADVAEACWCCGRKGGLLEFSGEKRTVTICTECAQTVARKTA